MNVIEFKSLPRDRQQAFADHIYKEIYRHKDDIERAYRELDYIALNFGIIPDRIYIGQWIEVIPNDENTQKD